MTTISTEQQPAKLMIPAEYLEDARSALVTEVKQDDDALRTADPVDRERSAVILQRHARLLAEVYDATGDVEMTAEADTISHPLFHVLEGMVRLLHDRLGDVVQYAPLPMDEALDVAERLQWAAGEAVRMDLPTVTLTREQRDGLCDHIRSYLTENVSQCFPWEGLREIRRRMKQCEPILDRLGWVETGDADSYELPVTAAVLLLAMTLRPDIEQTIRDDQRYRDHLAFDRAALEAVELIEAAGSDSETRSARSAVSASEPDHAPGMPSSHE